MLMDNYFCFQFEIHISNGIATQKKLTSLKLYQNLLTILVYENFKFVFLLHISVKFRLDQKFNCNKNKQLFCKDNLLNQIQNQLFSFNTPFCRVRNFWNWKLIAN